MDNFKVLKPFLIAGTPQPVDSVVTIDDAELASHLLSAEKIAPGDAATASRWHQKPASNWKAVEPGGVFRRNP